MKRRSTMTGRLIARAAAGIDRAVTLAVRAGSPGPESETRPLSHEARVRALRDLVARYAELDTGRYFPPPRAIDPVYRARGTLRKCERADLAWPSQSGTFLPEMAETYERTLENRVAVARLLSRGTPRPVAILVHGYLCGQLPLEERLWPLAALDEQGIDCAFIVLPFHGRRADPRRTGRPEFPGRDPRMANEGFRQAVTDLRELARHLRERGHPKVGVLGMSLGGYTAALAATVDADFDVVVPIVPLASLADFALEQGDLPEAPETRALEHRLVEEAHRLVSPVHRTPLVPAGRTLVLGARADRITPIAHARRLAAHFQAPLATLPGSHLVQLGRASGYERLFEMFRELGFGGR